jgi:hypothetical protein
MQIHKLQSDNDLMKRIIYDSESMSELLARYNEPLKISTTGTKLNHLRVEKVMSFPVEYDEEFIRKLMAKFVADELSETIENHMEIEYIPTCENERRVKVSFDYWIK